MGGVATAVTGIIAGTAIRGISRRIAERKNDNLQEELRDSYNRN